MEGQYCDHDDNNIGKPWCNPEACSEYKVKGKYINKLDSKETGKIRNIGKFKEMFISLGYDEKTAEEKAEQLKQLSEDMEEFALLASNNESEKINNNVIIEALQDYLD